MIVNYISKCCKKEAKLEGNVAFICSGCGKPCSIKTQRNTRRGYCYNSPGCEEDHCRCDDIDEEEVVSLMGVENYK